MKPTKRDKEWEAAKKAKKLKDTEGRIFHISGKRHLKGKRH